MAPHFEIGGVSPIDATVAIRSLPRRFGEAFARATSPEQVTPAVLGHAAWTATALDSIRRALQRVVLQSDPSIELPPADPAAPVTVNGPAATVLAQLAAAATALADAMADMGGQDWTRTGQTTNGPVTALDIAQLAVRIGIEHLRAGESAIAAGGGVRVAQAAPGADAGGPEVSAPEAMGIQTGRKGGTWNARKVT